MGRRLRGQRSQRRQCVDGCFRVRTLSCHRTSMQECTVETERHLGHVSFDFCLFKFVDNLVLILIKVI